MNRISNRYIKSVELLRAKVPSLLEYPFCVPAISTLNVMKMHPKVTFIIGENGSGKSTLLEAIALGYGFNAEGGSKHFKFQTSATHSILHQYIRLIKGARMARDGFFLRSESFYNVATNVDEIDTVDGKMLPNYGGKSLHSQSHGESFMALIMKRFGGKGLYILDEPESGLSPSRQLALISRIDELVKNDSQFIIATHSPIIMAYPNAVIYNADDAFNEIAYTDTEHYRTTRNFLNNWQPSLDILVPNWRE